MVLLINMMHTFQHDQDDTQDNQYKKNYIKKFSRMGIGFINNFMKFVFPSRMCLFFRQGAGFNGMTLSLLFFLRYDSMMKVVFSSLGIEVIIDSKI